jgi:hypothetical protein
VQDGSKLSEAESSARIISLDHEKLRALASNDPEAFERYREKLYQKVVDQAPIELQRRLKGIQFKLNMARKAAGNPISSCMRISEMMHDSFVELKLALANPQKYLHEQKSKHVESAEIIQLFPKQ